MNRLLRAGFAGLFAFLVAAAALAQGGAPSIGTPRPLSPQTLHDAGGMLRLNNLSDVANVATARTNLGLTGAATCVLGTAANNCVQLDGSARLPAVNASLLTALNASQLTSGTMPAARLPTLAAANFWLGNGSSVATAVALSGDCALSNAGAITCTKTNAVSFGYFATGTDAANLTGAIASARLSGAYTGVTGLGTLGADLLFTDGLYDIGKSGLTRPRNIFASGTGTFGGTVTGTQGIFTGGTAISLSSAGADILDSTTGNRLRVGAAANQVEFFNNTGPKGVVLDFSTDNVWTLLRRDGVAQATVQAGNLYATGYLGSSGKSLIYPNGTDGKIVLYNNAATGFTALQFGGTSASEPSIKRSGAVLAFRLADDSADANITAGQITTSSNINVAAGATINWIGRSIISPATDGTLTFYTNAGTIGARLDFATDATLKVFARDGTTPAALQAGSGVFGGTLTGAGLFSTGNVQAATSNAYSWGSRNWFTAPADGKYGFANNAATAGGILDLTTDGTFKLYARDGTTAAALTAKTITLSDGGANVIGATSTPITISTSGANLYLSPQGLTAAMTFTSNGGVPAMQQRAAGVYGWASTANSYDAMDIGLARNAAGIMEVNNGTAGTYRDIKVRGTLVAGSTPGNTGSCGATFAGGSTGGTITLVGACAGGTIILSMPTAPTGWVCNASNRTTPANAFNQTASSTTSATFTGTGSGSDVLGYHCTGY